MDNSLTNEQRIEAIKRLETSQGPEARIILEGLDRLLSDEDVGQVMNDLTASLSMFQQSIERATVTDTILKDLRNNGPIREAMKNI